MNYNTDGFNERSFYVHSSNDANKLKEKEPVSYDNSLPTFKMNENKPDIKTSSNEKTIGNQDLNVNNSLLHSMGINNIRNNNRFGGLK